MAGVSKIERKGNLPSRMALSSVDLPAPVAIARNGYPAEITGGKLCRVKRTAIKCNNVPILHGAERSLFIGPIPDTRQGKGRMKSASPLLIVPFRFPCPIFSYLFLDAILQMAHYLLNADHEVNTLFKQLFF